MKLMIHAAAALLLSIAPLAHAQPAPVAAKPALWELNDEDTKIYLFGTIHVLPKDYKWMTPTLDKAMADADELILEVPDMDDQVKSAETFIGLAMSPDMPPVNERIAPDKRAAMDGLIAKSGIPVFMLDQFESWAVALTLAVGSLTELGLTPEDGAEKTLMAVFKKAGKPVGGLETTEQQLGFFDTLPEADQRIFLASMVDGSVDAKAEFDAMISAWAAGDLAKIALSFDDEAQMSPILVDRLLRQRNANWAVWIADRMAQPGTIFIGVGAGHLAGPDSVQAMLTAKGYKITRLQ